MDRKLPCVETMMTFSTAHLAVEDLKRLEQDQHQLVLVYDEGYLIKILDWYSVELGRYSPGLIEILKEANSSLVDWVRFDRDYEKVEGFPTHE